VRRQLVTPWSPIMLDLVFLAAGVGMLALAAGYASLCERL
jgi:hypothetical protein